MNKESVRNRLLERRRENQSLLSASLQPGFQFKQVTIGGEIDATEHYRDQLRKAISDYQHAIDALAPGG